MRVPMLSASCWRNRSLMPGSIARGRRGGTRGAVSAFGDDPCRGNLLSRETTEGDVWKGNLVPANEYALAAKHSRGERWHIQWPSRQHFDEDLLRSGRLIRRDTGIRGD